MNKRWPIIILASLFLTYSTCHTASLIEKHDFDKKNITPSVANETTYDDKRHWLTIVTCLEHNPYRIPVLEGWTIFAQERNISRKIVTLRTSLSLGSKEQTPEQHIQAQRIAHVIKPSLMEKNGELWKMGNDLWCTKNALALEETRLSILQKSECRNSQLENGKKDKIQKKQQEIKTLEITIAELATKTMISSLAAYVAKPKKLDDILQGKNS